MPMFRGNARASERPTSELDDLLRTTTISEPGRMACSYAASGSTLDAHRTVDDFSRGSSLCCLEPARLLLFLRRRVTDDPNGDASIVRIASTPRLLRHEGSRLQPTGRSAKATPYREKMAAFSRPASQRIRSLPPQPSSHNVALACRPAFRPDIK
jgi:hypothetical protein